MRKILLAEVIGTFWLVFAGCGSALLAASFHGLGIGLGGVSLAFGLSVLTMAYAVGGVSGGHFNPAVTLGLAIAGRFRWADVAAYMASQVLGAVLAGAVLFVIVTGRPDPVITSFASNGYGELSPGGYGLIAAFATETVMTAIFLIVILGATSARVPPGFAPLAIGLCLTLIHLVSIPVTNTSVNPARSTGVALFAQTGALGQLWLFWLAPMLGAAGGGWLYKVLWSDPKPEPRLDPIFDPVPMSRPDVAAGPEAQAVPSDAPARKPATKRPPAQKA